MGPDDDLAGSLEIVSTRPAEALGASPARRSVRLRRSSTGVTTVDAIPGSQRVDGNAADPLAFAAPSFIGDFDGEGRPDLAVRTLHFLQDVPGDVLIIPLPFG